jgi:hypothetical protein
MKYSRSKIKNKKPIVVDFLFKAYPMVTLSCKIRDAMSHS